MLQVNSTIFCYLTKNKTAKTRKSLGWGKKKTGRAMENANKTDWTPKHPVAWRLPTNLKPILPDVCEKNYFALFVPQPVENHTSAILCLSSCYNPCNTQSYKKRTQDYLANMGGGSNNISSISSTSDSENTAISWTGECWSSIPFSSSRSRSGSSIPSQQK